MLNNEVSSSEASQLLAVSLQPMSLSRSDAAHSHSQRSMSHY